MSPHRFTHVTALIHVRQCDDFHASPQRLVVVFVRLKKYYRKYRNPYSNMCVAVLR